MSDEQTSRDDLNPFAAHRAKREARRLGELVRRTADTDRTLAWLDE